MLAVALGVLMVAACTGAPDLRPLAADAVIMAYGDSLTFGTGAKPDAAYPAELQRLLKRTVVNAGVPGETSTAGLHRLGGELAAHTPALVVLCHGGNDILRRRPLESLERNLHGMIDLIREHGAQVVMLGVPGRNLTLAAAPTYAKVADGLDVPLDADAIPALMRKRAFKSDPIHFNAAGYAAMARAVRDLIRDAGGLDGA